MSNLSTGRRHVLLASRASNSAVALVLALCRRLQASLSVRSAQFVPVFAASSLQNQRPGAVGNRSQIWLLFVGGKVDGGLSILSGLADVLAQFGSGFTSLFPGFDRLLSHSFAQLFRQPVLSVVGGFYPISTDTTTTTTGFKKGGSL